MKYILFMCFAIAFLVLLFFIEKVELRKVSKQVNRDIGLMEIKSELYSLENYIIKHQKNLSNDKYLVNVMDLIDNFDRIKKSDFKENSISDIIEIFQKLQDLNKKEKKILRKYYEINQGFCKVAYPIKYRSILIKKRLEMNFLSMIVVFYIALKNINKGISAFIKFFPQERILEVSGYRDIKDKGTPKKYIIMNSI